MLSPLEKPKRHQLAVIELITQHFAGSKLTGAEIGVYRGHTSFRLLEALPNLEKLFLIDLFDERHFFKSFAVNSMAEAEAEARRRLECYATRCCWMKQESLQAAAELADASLDFIFLDASHYYDDVKADLNAWSCKVKPCGLIVGHDYDGRGDNMRRNPFGVKRAVDEHVAKVGAALMLRKGNVWAYVK